MRSTLRQLDAPEDVTILLPVLKKRRRLIQMPTTSCHHDYPLVAIGIWIVFSVACLPITQAFSATPTLTKHRRAEAFDAGNVVDLSSLEYCRSNAAKKSHQQKAPVIFLHGLLGNKRNFNSIARSLCTRLKDPRKILGLDLRNHGDNTECISDMSYTSMAKDVLNFMDSNDLPRVELIGHSVGGKVAQ